MDAKSMCLTRKPSCTPLAQVSTGQGEATECIAWISASPQDRDKPQSALHGSAHLHRTGISHRAHCMDQRISTGQG
eukprot:1160457-Pelagomonas_calceolata.AAC.11